MWCDGFADKVCFSEPATEQETSPMRFMRERLVELVQGLSVRRATGVPTPVVSATQTDAEDDVEGEDSADECKTSRKPTPLKLRKKHKSRALG